MTASTALAPPRGRVAGQPRDVEIQVRLGKVKGQLNGITSMYESGRCCTDILDQVAAARAAIDAVGLILLQDHIGSCVRDAVDAADSDEKVAELVGAVRRYLRSR